MAQGAHIIVLGNEKGGSGKSTTAMHLITALLYEGRSVAAIDLDSRQKSLARYMENRQAFNARKGIALPMPDIEVIPRSDARSRDEAEAEERETFERLLGRMRTAYDVLVIDSPGSDTWLSRLAHASADTIVTPLNDSFVDLDLLARVNAETYEIEKPSHYAEMVWEARKHRALRDRGQIDWIVIRNRVTVLNARNKARVEHVLEKLSRRIGFRFLPGLSERVIFRELFLKGLTLVDLKATGRAGATGALTMSQVAARQEIRRLVEALGLPPAHRMLKAAG
ncbi:MAG: division plane positioning ATPase MipZ [Rhodothalassiaceae bacterium]